MSSQDDSEAFHLKKKIIPGHIDVHPTDSAIVVHYTVQASILGENGQPVVDDRKTLQKIVRIKALHPGSNLSALAQEVVDKCKLISPSKTREVEQLLYYLQQRQGGDDEGGMVSDREWLRRQLENQKKQEEPLKVEEPELEAPSIANVEQYIEGLYEDIPDKMKSTRYVLELARQPENLEVLVTNDALMSALSRVLREDNRKSTVLNTNIITIFYCFSQFLQYHGVITTHKVGDMCLRIIEMEMKRFEMWVGDLKTVEEKCARNPTDKALIVDAEQEHRKFQAMLQKQDQLLFVSFHLLFNLAQDLTIEPKMVKRGIIKLLVTVLDRQTPELLILVIGFLKRLSVIRENKNELVAMGDEFLSKVDRLIPCDHPVVQELALRLIFNLSHDAAFRSLLLRKNFLPKIVALLHSSVTSGASKNIPELVLEVLYMMSLDDKGRVGLAGVDAASLLLRLILSQPLTPISSSQSPERLALMALGVNLSMHPRTVPPLLADNSLKFLMKRVMKTKDPLLIKMLRGVAGCGDSGRMSFLDYIDDIMHLLLKNANHDEVLVEVTGLLAALSIPDFDFAKLAETYNLLDFISGKLQRSIAAVTAATSGNGGISAAGGGGTGGGLAEDDDVTLEIVILLGTMANDENIGPMVARTGILPLLMELMIAKEDDDEMILQIIYCAYQFLLLDSTRTMLINKTQLVSYLIDLLYDRNVEIRKMCDVCLDLICETNTEYLSKIRHQKFHYHNSEWLHRIAQSTASASSVNMYTVEDDAVGMGYQKYAGAGRRGAIVDVNDAWSDSESEDESDGDDFGRGMVVGGNSALLDGF
ncbi:uncharacterized protein SPPG_02058 [Spizellomyces punctatus DAOM BR117]|uniref:Kinesin-associated protein 3 n=1 Tax=Spizellomyces punctatus (strain DAOM BR117) TaxID=645134 RepID=A0A0L0HPJ7_SPIPD|nr:uncharacterized protein SPPG_02058 [Spizellomyces punctatus DAOM BR117]KND02983.1 hypothetical protein SPPG_02058 [Spizellomyces punctatus DAOM BR117]|eukprot:XP_016611022.1 hypothetical protein SPPG_02058 [Spizellomyces punctatus DAOM BR117]